MNKQNRNFKNLSVDPDLSYLLGNQSECFNFLLSHSYIVYVEKKTKNNDARDGKIQGIISSTDQLLTPRREI